MLMTFFNIPYLGTETHIYLRLLYCNFSEYKSLHATNHLIYVPLENYCHSMYNICPFTNCITCSEIMSTKPTTCICLFIQITCCLHVPFVLNINIYLFTYSNQMSTEPHASDHLYLFIYANYLLFHVLFVLNINIYLFTYLNQCQQNHTQATTCICLFMQITCCSMCCSNEY